MLEFCICLFPARFLWFPAVCCLGAWVRLVSVTSLRRRPAGRRSGDREQPRSQCHQRGKALDARMALETRFDHELWESLHSYILIKLSPYQHLCCIMSLMASFCTKKSPTFAGFLSIFLHAFSVFDLSVIYTPNGKTAEPEYYRRAAKTKERMGGKSLLGC